MCQASSEDDERGEEEKEALVSGGSSTILTGPASPGSPIHPLRGPLRESSSASTRALQPVQNDGFQPECLHVISDQAVTVWGTLWKYLEQGLKGNLSRPTGTSRASDVRADRQETEGGARGPKRRGRVGTTAEERSCLPAGVSATGRATSSSQTREQQPNSDRVWNLK